MNGISLAALLGAATWFGLRVPGEEDEADENSGAAGDAPLPVQPVEGSKLARMSSSGRRDRCSNRPRP